MFNLVTTQSFSIWILSWSEWESLLRFPLNRIWLSFYFHSFLINVMKIGRNLKKSRFNLLILYALLLSRWCFPESYLTIPLLFRNAMKSQINDNNAKLMISISKIDVQFYHKSITNFYNDITKSPPKSLLPFIRWNF